MSELDARRLRRKAEDYADDDPDDASKPAPYEQTYRDGSLKNECWRSDDDR